MVWIVSLTEEFSEGISFKLWPKRSSRGVRNSSAQEGDRTLTLLKSTRTDSPFLMVFSVGRKAANASLPA